jgi:hypothetical protein
LDLRLLVFEQFCGVLLLSILLLDQMAGLPVEDQPNVRQHFVIISIAFFILFILPIHSMTALLLLFTVSALFNISKLNQLSN